MSCRQHTYFKPLELGVLQLCPDGPLCCQATLPSRGILSRRICVRHCVVLPLPDTDFRLPPTETGISAGALFTSGQFDWC